MLNVQTILHQHIIYIIKKKEKIWFAISMSWLKFEMKATGVSIHNFNLIPSGDIAFIPAFYAEMLKVVKNFRKNQPDYLKNLKKFNSKNTYVILRKPFEKKPKCEENIGLNIAWGEVYKKINDPKIHSELRSSNYKILNNGLTLDLKLPWKRNLKCPLCRKRPQNREHVFVNCEVTKECLGIATQLNKNIKRVNTENYILYNIGLEIEEVKIVSLHKFCMWKLYWMCVKNEMCDKKAIYKSIFLKYGLVYG